MGCEEGFIQQLRERGFRLTPQREMVLAVMHQIDGHATAEEIHGQVQRISSSVDISTVYRTLELLQELQMVATVDLGDGQRRYELLGLHGRHHHLLCRSCGELVRVEHEEIRPLVAHVEKAHGFRADPDHLVIVGICRGCRAVEEALPEDREASGSGDPEP